MPSVAGSPLDDEGPIGRISNSLWERSNLVAAAIVVGILVLLTASYLLPPSTFRVKANSGIDKVVPGLSSANVKTVVRVVAQSRNSIASQVRVVAPDKTFSVFIGDSRFDPPDVFVPPGSTVVWRNEGESVHSIAAKDFSSDWLQPGDSYNRSFLSNGTFEYRDGLHAKISGRVIVQ